MPYRFTIRGVAVECDTMAELLAALGGNHAEASAERHEQDASVVGQVETETRPSSRVPTEESWGLLSTQELWKRLDEDQRVLIAAAIDGDGMTITDFAKRFGLKAGGVGKRLKGIETIVARDMPGLPVPVRLNGPRGAKTIAVDEMFSAVVTLAREERAAAKERKAKRDAKKAKTTAA